MKITVEVLERAIENYKSITPTTTYTEAYNKSVTLGLCHHFSCEEGIMVYSSYESEESSWFNKYQPNHLAVWFPTLPLRHQHDFDSAIGEENIAKCITPRIKILEQMLLDLKSENNGSN